MSRIQGQFLLQRSNFTLDVEFDFAHAGVTALFGPSGSGKTTLLRCIAGLEHAQGWLKVNHVDWQTKRTFLPAHRRSIGYVFQEASLFAHLNVQDNLLYGYKRTPAAQRKVQLAQVIEWLGLQSLINRRDVQHLSGGERQRVAIGRALLSSPSILLMDEPLSALDSQSKREILPYLEQLHRELKIPVLYVTHALDELIRLADEVVLLEQGKILAAGELMRTLTLLDLPLAHVDDASAVIAGQITQHDNTYHLSQLSFSGGWLWISHVPQPLGVGQRVRILARDVSIAMQIPQGSSICNILQGDIVQICDEDPDKVLVKLKVGDFTLLSRITRRSRDRLSLEVGMQVYAQVKSVALM